jgi:RIO-like serine/threonine protein kinase
MIRLNNYIIKLLKNKLNRSDLDESKLILLNKGKFANAYVFRYSQGDTDLTIKDFSHCPWPVKITVGIIMAKFEYKTLKLLEGLPGVASEAFLLGRYTVAFSYVKGTPLAEIHRKNMTLPKEFFIELEKRTREMHNKNLVHLDLRNLGNIIEGDDGNPYIIDFQSSLGTKYLPKKLKKILEDSDISGVYKSWKLVCSENLDPEKEKFLEDFNKIRKIWVFKGYPIQKAIRKIKRKINKD